MTDAVANRGPDDRGIFIDEEIPAAVGHRRLSILDLSHAGHQPMMDSSGRYVLVYNGETYNFHELRRQLQARGTRFTSDSDTEVVLAAFVQWGVECVHRFRGMFAFAILDRGASFGPDPKSRSRLPKPPYMFLARDRLGIKPLVYAETSSGFVFGSELRSLLAANVVDRRIDRQSLVNYMAYGAVQQPRTIVSDVFQMQPASCLTVSDAGRIVDRWQYWDLVQASNANRQLYSQRPYHELVKRTRISLEDSSRQHLISDVPVGAFLSGGVDSAAVVALMGQATATRVKTFSVGFERQTEVTDESEAANSVARSLRTDHTAVTVDATGVAGSFAHFVSCLDQPSIDGFNTFLVSAAASRDVKVVISGLGGDELFAGYGHFSLYQASQSCAPRWFDPPAAWIHQRRANSFTLKSAYRHSKPQSLTLPRRLHGERKLRAVLNARFAVLSPDSLITRFDASYRDLDPVAEMSLVECNGYLNSTLLRDSDVLSMAHAIELRPPLLDHLLVEHVFALPGSAKIRNGVMKCILIDAVRDLIPETCWKVPKRGFELPFGTWLNGVLNERLNEAVNSAVSDLVFSPAYLKRLRRAAFSRRADRGCWMPFILLEWLGHTRLALD